MSDLKYHPSAAKQADSAGPFRFPTMDQFKNASHEAPTGPEEHAFDLARSIEEALNDVQRRLDDVRNQLDDAFRMPSHSDDWPPAAA